MKNKFIKYAFISVLFLLALVGLTEVKAEEYYTGEAIWASEYIDGIYMKKVKSEYSYEYKQSRFIRRSEDNQFVYCLEPFSDVNNYTPYEIHRDNFAKILELSEDDWTRISLLAYYGYGYYENGYNHWNNKWYAVTQLMIWQVVDKNADFYFTDTLNGNRIYDYDDEIAEMNSLVNNHFTRPSFNIDTTTIPLGQSRTYHDANGVLQYYSVVSTSNVNASISGNTLTITATGIGDAKVNLAKKATNYEAPPIVYTHPDSQDVMRVGYYDPVTTNMNFKIVGGRVKATKHDNQTLSIVPLGDAQLIGAIYGVYNEQDVRVGQVTIGDDSTGISDYLPTLGRFYLKEEVASKGYELDSNIYWFEVSEQELTANITVYEQVIDKEVHLYKVFADGTTTILTSEPNIEFEFILKSSMQVYTTAKTDSDGKLSVILPYGTFIIRQKTTTPNYEKLKDFEIVIDETGEEEITKILSNSEITAKPKIIKVDSDSKKVLVRDGIRFMIKNIDTNKYICQNVTYPNEQEICVFETKDGYFITPYVLGSGNYQIEELEDQVIEGYIWNNEPLKFSINENSKFVYDDKYGVILEVMFENKQVKGEIEVNKLGEKLVMENDTYTYEEIKLSDIGFGLYAQEDIYSYDGTLIYKKDDLVTSFKTVDGYFKISDLYLGKYCLIEESTLDSLVLDSTPHCFELKYEDQYTPIVSMSFTFKNYHKKGTLIFNKTDLTTAEPIPNTTIEIYHVNPDDESIVTLVFSGTTSNDGSIVIDNLFPSKFYIVEKQSADGYQITDEIIYFEIKENGEVVKASMTNEKIEIEVPNTGLSDSKVFNVIVLVCIIAGVGYVIYDKKRKK